MDTLQQIRGRVLFRIEGFENLGFFHDLNEAVRIRSMTKTGRFFLLKEGCNRACYVYVDDNLEGIPKELSNLFETDCIINVKPESLITGIDLVGGLFSGCYVRCADLRILQDSLLELSNSCDSFYPVISEHPIIKLNNERNFVLNKSYNGFTTDASVFAEFMRTSSFVKGIHAYSIINAGYSAPTKEFMVAVSSMNGFEDCEIVSSKDVDLSMPLDEFYSPYGRLDYYGRLTLSDFLSNSAYYSFCIAPMCGVKSCI